ncbi:hypothetical protein LK994_13520 [Ferruginibacter lapsinanis]|uniref:hypothetical protein n=1 Tax=Ferruginibacter lapsinanis TaxID=563172 RepID=UPI001E573C4D|nr:hypothetical protein [Ferruginibacter lapsinanis]UEG49656.1 hypothetical protein LK994_13520 [Ferruginibacter lapsinanis]
MRNKKKQKLKEEQFWSSFAFFNVPKNLETIPSHIERVNFRIWDHVEDEQIEMMVQHIRSINMLDLDETDITNYSVQLLSQLDCIKELRLKGCREIDDAAFPHLNNIKGLELLHLGGTSVSINGLMQLSVNHNLRMLLVSIDEPEKHHSDLTTIAQRFPNCELIVNHQEFIP